MALSTRAVKPLACSSCQQWVLRSIINVFCSSSLHQTPLRAKAFSTSYLRNEAGERQQIKDERWATSQSSRSLAPFIVERIPSHSDEFPDDVGRPQQDPGSDADAAPIPLESSKWYLENDTPILHQGNAISKRQEIPNLPEHAPPILQPLLQRISLDLGMDDLTLLDLRGIDPPPALGSNLFMIVGTARSEKHLHFSADKLCRWLRTEFGLVPVADGLLGRQELKLKMRRRAKRSRLLSAVGAKVTADTQVDEGIRTGWICVNVGNVEGGNLPKSEVEIQREESIVGFGTRASGSQIVIQLLTEEKRGEIELERLWNAVLKKSNQGRKHLLEDDQDNN